MTTDLRRWMMLCEDGNALSGLLARKSALLPGLTQSMDDRSVAIVLEWTDEPNSEALADAWFDVCLGIYRRIVQRGNCPIFRHMMVEDFKTFIQSLHDGTGRLGEYWSIHYGIESPTWKRDQQGDVPVSIEGEIAAKQIDWMATLRQNFEWPHEGEMIFTGDVLVLRIEDRDTGAEVRPKEWYSR